ncbi:CYCLIN D3-2 [Trifolium repens]|nr:CYCLIN D3-2 [Trifolium repens]
MGIDLNELNNGKVSILCEASKLLKDLLCQIQSLLSICKIDNGPVNAILGSKWLSGEGFVMGSTLSGEGKVSTPVEVSRSFVYKYPEAFIYAKTLQIEELLVLSTLKWRMHTVTPISLFENIVRRLGLKSCLHWEWEFMWRCERVLLHVIVDSRVMMSYLPSTLATTTIKGIPFNATEYIDQLMSGFGSVYKGSLGDGTLVAVKKHDKILPHGDR